MGRGRLDGDGDERDAGLAERSKSERGEVGAEKLTRWDMLPWRVECDMVVREEGDAIKVSFEGPERSERPNTFVPHWSDDSGERAQVAREQVHQRASCTTPEDAA